MSKQEQWNSQLGFIISGIGAAIGLGNLWLFPWRLVECGGGSFLILYLFFIFLFVRMGLTAEVAFGRAFQTGPIGCFTAVVPPKYKKYMILPGILPGLALLSILCFYLVVTGWIIHYALHYFMHFGTYITEPAAYFQNYTSSSDTLYTFIIALILTTIIVLMGVNNGIEKTNKIAMPLFFILIIILLFKSLTIPGSIDALKHMFRVNPEDLINPHTWIMALGQTFFTVCLGGMLTYGSYLSKKADVISASFWTVLFNTAASILSALAIVPALFAYDLGMSSGPSLLFVSIPKLCLNMSGGNWFAPIFFFCVLLAAISSAANLMETAVATLSPLLKTKRVYSTCIVALLLFATGYHLTTNIDSFSSWTDFVTIYFYPFIPLIIQIAFIWIYGRKKAMEEIAVGAKWKLFAIDKFILIYVFPIICFIVIILNIIFNGIG